MFKIYLKKKELFTLVLVNWYKLLATIYITQKFCVHLP